MNKYKIANAWYPDKLPWKCLIPSKDTISPGELKKDHILVLWGGEDIATEIYNQKPNKYVNTYKKSLRDIEEIALAKEAIALSIPILGICRGAQLLCCLSGGSLIQHIEDHNENTHPVTTYTQDKLFSNSCHHQMMVPSAEQKVLAYAKKTTGLGEKNIPLEITNVPEIVYFPKIRALGIQGHPEWPSMPKPFLNYCESLIISLLL